MNKKTVNCLVEFFSEEIPADMQKVLEFQIETMFVDKAEADEIKGKLEAAGAEVELA